MTPYSQPLADEARFGRRAIALSRAHALGLPTVPGVVLEPGASLDEAIAHLEKQTGRRFGHPEAPLVLSLTPSRAQHRDYRKTATGLGVSSAWLDKVKNRTSAEGCLRHSVASALRILAGVEEEDLDTVFDTDSTMEDIVRFAETTYRQRRGKEWPTTERTLIDALYQAMSLEGPVLFQAMTQLMSAEEATLSHTQSREADVGSAEVKVLQLPNAQLADLFALRRHPAAPPDITPFHAIAKKLEAGFKHPVSFVSLLQGDKHELVDIEPLRTSSRATLRIAVAMAKEGVHSEADALMAITPATLEQLIHPNIAQGAKRRVVAKGLPASPGAATGVVVFSAEDAQTVATSGRRAILVRIDTTPEDIHGMTVADGVLTTRGGLTSHAAVVARGLGKCCVVGCTDIRVDYQSKSFSTATETVKDGDTITLDGQTGEVMWGAVETRLPEMGDDFDEVQRWADKHRRLGVRANVNSLADADVAIRFGVEGVGLCRTEQLLLAPQRLKAWREVLFATSTSDRRAALERLLPLHRADLIDLLHKLAPRPVAMRLLDPPLGEFIPQSESELHDLAKQHGVTDRLLRQRRDALHEVNPMLGHRGCRLAVTYPELYEMQVRAILEAANDLMDKNVTVDIELMFPMISSAAELTYVRTLAERVGAAVAAERKRKVPYRVGAMIEVPRAALLAGEIAAQADFFSFGTNDLTQTVFGISRDDAGRFLGSYIETKLLASDPFSTLDRQVVAPLIDQAVRSGRAQNGKLQLGLCGEHGGDPASIEFCDQLALDYVSCSPYRVPIAKLAAARARIESGRR